MTDLFPTPPSADVQKMEDTMKERIAKLLRLLEGEAVKVDELYGSWRCSLCEANGEDEEKITHVLGCELEELNVS